MSSQKAADNRPITSDTDDGDEYDNSLCCKIERKDVIMMGSLFALIAAVVFKTYIVFSMLADSGFHIFKTSRFVIRNKQRPFFCLGALDAEVTSVGNKVNYLAKLTSIAYNGIETVDNDLTVVNQELDSFKGSRRRQVMQLA